MYKNIFLSLSLLLLSGCAERGYKLTVNNYTHTAIAQSTKSIDADTPDTSIKLNKMVKAAKHELKKNRKSTIRPINHLNNETLLSSSTEDLIFKRLNKTYQKFGNSEIHGHVIYLTPLGVETRLQNTNIYLLKANNTLNLWYSHSYLKDNNSGHPLTVKYLNNTYLDLSKNFAFHGIAPGTYYVIIVSDIQKSGDKKVYIAKKIEVETRKKIMAVFSKKLSKKTTIPPVM